MNGRLRSDSPFSVPLFRKMWAAGMVSNLGGMIQSVGAAWLMTTLSGSPLMIALVQASTSLPVMLLTLWAGAVADNLDRRRVMLVTQVFMFLVSSALTALACADRLSPLILLVFTFLIGCGTAINWPSMQVAFSDCVPKSLMPRAVALNGMGVNIARSVGPAIGGAIMASFGAVAAFGLNTASYLGLIAVLRDWKYAPPERVMPREDLGAAMMAGLRYALMSPAIGIVIVRSLAFGLAASAIPALMPLVARDLVQGGPLTFGMLLGGFGIGAVSGAFIISRLRSIWTSERIVQVACLLMGTSSILAGWAHTLISALPAMALAGGAWLITLSTFNVTMQAVSPRWVVARALSLYQMAFFGGLTLGSWGFGSFAAAEGVSASLSLAGASLVVVALIGFILPIQALAEPDLDPRTEWVMPDTTIPVHLRSGPIVLTIEHRVSEDNAIAFVNAMAERSRILRRDGARHWKLLRDLVDNELWVERYDLPTWADYVRLNQRRTRDDESNLAVLENLRIPGCPLVVHRRIERPISSLPWTSRSDEPSFEGVSVTTGPV